MYGLGNAEAALRPLTKNRRSEIQIVSKAGILPPYGLAANHWQRRLAVNINRLPGIKVRVSNPANPRFGQFDLATMEASLETSLRELGTDYLDLLLLHEPQLEDLSDGQVLGFLKTQVRKGKIVSFGIAATRSETQRILAAQPGTWPVVQVAYDLIHDGAHPIGAQSGSKLILHSILKSAAPSLDALFSNNPQFAEQWEVKTRVPHHNAAAMAQLIFSMVHKLVGGPTLLFSSSKREHIHSIANCLKLGGLLTFQVEAAAQLLAEAESKFGLAVMDAHG